MGYSVLLGLQYCGRYHDLCGGGIMSTVGDVQYCGEISLSTVVDVQYCGRYHDLCGEACLGTVWVSQYCGNNLYEHQSLVMISIIYHVWYSVGSSLDNIVSNSFFSHFSHVLGQISPVPRVLEKLIYFNDSKNTMNGCKKHQQVILRYLSNTQKVRKKISTFFKYKVSII